MKLRKIVGCKQSRALVLVVAFSFILLAPAMIGQSFGAFVSSYFTSGVCGPSEVEKNGIFFLSISNGNLNQDDEDVDVQTVEFHAGNQTSAQPFSNHGSTLELLVNGSTIEMGDIPLFINFTETGDNTGIFNAAGLDMSIVDRSVVGGLRPGYNITFAYVDPTDVAGKDCIIKIKKSPVFIALRPVSSVVSGTTFTASGMLFDGISGEPLSGRTITFEAPGSSDLDDTTTRGFIIQDPSNLQVVPCNSTQPSNPAGSDDILGNADDLYSDCIADDEFGIDGINNVLHLNAGSKIIPPTGTKGIMLFLQDMGLNSVNLIVKDDDAATPDHIERVMGMDPDALNFALVSPMGNDITEIEIGDVIPVGSGPTVGISRIESFDPNGDPHTLIVADFEDIITPISQPSLEVGAGSFFSIGTANVDDGSWAVKAKFDGDESYLPAETDATFSTIEATWGGGGGGYTILPETWTGFSAINCSSDTDFDSLCNSWETSGIPYQLGGTQYYLLCGNFVGEAAGTCAANGDKDIFVELDYMSGYTPLDTAINDVRTKFDAMGYKLHVLKNEQITWSSQIDVWADTDGNNNDDFYNIKQKWFGTSTEQGTLNLLGSALLKAKGQAYHYGVFVRSIGNCGPSGIAETPGNDFVVALATDCTPGFENSREEQAGTFMHELGHNLNLDHGGPRDIKALSGVLVGLNNGAVQDGASGDTSRSYSINSGMSVQYSSSTSGEIFLTNSLTFSGDPGTTTVGTVSIPSPGSKMNIDIAGIQKIISLPAAATSNTRHVQLKIPFSTTGSTTATSGALGQIFVDITVSTTSRTLDSIGKPGYSPNIRLDVNPNDYTMNCKANYPSVMSYSTQFPYMYTNAVPPQPWPLDYSNEVIGTIDEGDLTESAGLQSTINPRTVVFGTPFTQPLKDYLWGMTYVTGAPTGIDWKGDGGYLWSGSADLNDFDIRGCGLNDSGGAAPTPGQIQVGFNDWNNVQLDFRKEAQMIDGVFPNPIKSAEMTPEIVQQIRTLYPGHYTDIPWVLVVPLLVIAIAAAILAAFFFFTHRPLWLVIAMIAIAAVAAAAIAIFFYLS